MKQLEKASALSASDDPADQDKAREIRVRHDYESLKKQISSKKKPTRAAVKEGVHVVDGEKYLKLPRKVAKGVKRDSDERHELGKIKDAVTDALGKTNTKRDGVKKPEGIKGFFSMQNSYEPEGEIVEEASYKDFVKKAQDASSRVKKAKQAERESNAKSAYKDKVTKGVRFYDKKGSGHIRDGKKVYS